MPPKKSTTLTKKKVGRGETQEEREQRLATERNRKQEQRLATEKNPKRQKRMQNDDCNINQPADLHNLESKLPGTSGLSIRRKRQESTQSDEPTQTDSSRPQTPRTFVDELTHQVRQFFAVQTGTFNDIWTEQRQVRDIVTEGTTGVHLQNSKFTILQDILIRPANNVINRPGQSSLPIEEREQRELNVAADPEPLPVVVVPVLDAERAPVADNNRNRNLRRPGFDYQPNFNYARHSNIGEMSVVCTLCNARRYRDEGKSICCASGKVLLPDIPLPPEPLRALIYREHPYSNHFFGHIRDYNSAFQMTSFGATEVSEPNTLTFRIQGQIYHRIGSLLPVENRTQRFLQIYFISDYQRQANVRMGEHPNLNRQLLLSLQTMLFESHPYIRDLITAMEALPRLGDNYRLVIHADRRPAGEHRGRYNAPVTDEVAVLMVGEDVSNRDIILRYRDNRLERISETHRSYDTLQYPLIFSHGDNGYHFNVYQVSPVTRDQIPGKKVSAMQFYSFQMMFRDESNNLILRFGNLTNLYWVDMYAKIESERLLFIRINQRKLRSEDYIHLQDAIRRDDNPENVGRLVILPSSFTAGPRYMQERTQDAFCYIRKHGRPDLFITFTCNPTWEEITNALLPGQRYQERHDLVSRIFKLKLNKLMDMFLKSKFFGKVLCYIYTIEWQKRGLPHAHILLWLEDKIRPNEIDQVISAELPDRTVDPELFDIVRRQMIHGPCGHINRNSSCMKNGRCSNHFPKRFCDETIANDDGYPTYRRRSPASGGFTAEKLIDGELFVADNRWVVPYSPILLKSFRCHINLEMCNNVQSIKYICKYVNKGSDQASFRIRNTYDEVEIYQCGRYISTSEAVWRILSFPIHTRYPPVVHLAVHLENGQRVYFRPGDLNGAFDAQRLANDPRKTTLMAFFHLCQREEFARTLLYNEVPAFYTFNKQNGVFSRRKQGRPVQGQPGIKEGDVIGRVYTVHPNYAECFYLRMLLHQVRGPTSFESLRTVHGVVHPTYKATCQSLGLLEDDAHLEETLQEARLSESPSMLRHLFAVILMQFKPTNALHLWDLNKNYMSEDGLRAVQRQLDDAAVIIDFSQFHNACLTKIQDILFSIGGGELASYGLPPTPAPGGEAEPHFNFEVHREISYDTQQLLSFIDDTAPRLTDEQAAVYRTILASVRGELDQNLFFLDAPGGTGKTFLINLLLATVRSERDIAVAVASSGIAATLIPGGRTAHSTFKIPIDIDSHEHPVCNVSRSSALAQVFVRCRLIVWDECTMANRKSIDAVDRTLRDVRRIDRPMGGVTVLFSGDFRQMLPVVVQGSRADQLRASLKNSLIWPMVQNLSLTQNMRLFSNTNVEGRREFSETLLKIGEGTMEQIEGRIRITPAICHTVPTVDELITKIYPDIQNLTLKNSLWLCERAILSPTNLTVDNLNASILDKFCAEERVYTSINTLMDVDEATDYPIEFLESLAIPGIPQHKIRLKVGAPIILLRNLSPPQLCNGTRLRIRALYRNLIDATILTGCGQGETTLIPRIPLTPSNYPINFKRLQFPVSVCFAMTINKAQGQTLTFAGVDLRQDVFTHGQLYVAMSRVTDPKNLFICTGNENNTIANVVYEEALRN